MHKYFTDRGIPAISPQEDLESLGYMIVYLLRGNLPWEGIRADTEDEEEAMILERKRTITPEELCEGLPDELAKYVRFSRIMTPTTVPNYRYIQQTFKSLAQKEAIEYDNVFDWTIKMYLQTKEKKNPAASK